MFEIIVVEPAGAGWSVDVPGLVNQMFFATGREAETVARRLATRLAGAGRGVEVEIRLRGGAIAGRYLCFPRAANEEETAAPAPRPMAVPKDSLAGGMTIIPHGTGGSGWQTSI
ncbi:MAG: hypothetical protein ACK4JY_13450 [Brevundimonas sp.]|uniref:hypothetical protein n=1 Tax=Brevundimonas sp. TaxID=1871086 RepID=UPI00391BBD55